MMTRSPLRICVPLQHVREAADIAVQLLVGERALIARLAFPEDRRLVAVRAGEMPVEAVFGNVELPAHEPLREWRLPLHHLAPRRLPGELLRLARPKLVR
jgi:hypothetical protein